jgi:hypothetical protein
MAETGASVEVVTRSMVAAVVLLPSKYVKEFNINILLHVIVLLLSGLCKGRGSRSGAVMQKGRVFLPFLTCS